MSKFKGEERITNDDGSQLKVQSYDDKIVVHEYDKEGNHTGRTTDWFDSYSHPGQVHVHDDDGNRWEGGGKPTSYDNDSSSDSSDSSSSSDSSDDSSSGGCFITSAVCTNFNKADDCVELTMFRHFRDTFMQETAEMRNETKEYYKIAPKICRAIDSLGKQIALKEYARIWQYSLEPAFTALNCNNKQEAYNIYKKMVLGLKENYLKEESN